MLFAVLLSILYQILLVDKQAIKPKKSKQTSKTAHLKFIEGDVKHVAVTAIFRRR